jgi:hypothetical protein
MLRPLQSALEPGTRHLSLSLWLPQDPADGDIVMSFTDHFAATFFFRASLVGLLLATPLLSGCAGVAAPTEELEPRFNEEILESLIGSTEDEVKKELGPPLYHFKGEEKSYFIYEGRVDVAGVAFLVGIPVPFWGGSTWICSQLEFGRSGRLNNVETFGAYITGPEDPAKLKCKNHFWSQEELAELEQAHKEYLEKRALRGDPEAMYEYAQQPHDPEERWKWVCLAAHHRLAKAQGKSGDYYRLGRSPISRDDIQAYLWYSLGADQGDFLAAQALKGLFQKMSLAQIAEAKSLLAKWEPNPAECETIGAAVQN